MSLLPVCAVDVVTAVVDVDGLLDKSSTITDRWLLDSEHFSKPSVSAFDFWSISFCILNDNLIILLGDGNDCDTKSPGKLFAVKLVDSCLLLQEGVCVAVLCKSSFLTEKSKGGAFVPTV